MKTSDLKIGTTLLLLATATTTVALGQHPHPQPRLMPSIQCPPPPGMAPNPACPELPANTTLFITGEGFFPPSNPFLNPPGSNFLPNVDTNMFDGLGLEMPNTLPSTPTIPYNLHEGTPVVSEINADSPTDDLFKLFDLLLPAAEQKDREQTLKLINLGLDILEGNPPTLGLRLLDSGLPRLRSYSGFPLLHYTGPEKFKTVEPIKNAQGETIGGHVDVHQIWYDSHIESDTSLLDPRFVLDVPWTITYTVDVLNRGNDDFSPFVIYTDNPEISDPFWMANGTPDPSDSAHLPGARLPHVGMDQSFFPMEDGTRTVFNIKMTPGKYFNLTYTWGWRMHPPRIQVIENALKSEMGKTLVEWERSVFGESPRQGQARSCRQSGDPRAEAIGQIGELSPAKRMWTTLCQAREGLEQGDYARVLEKTREAETAFDAWRERTKLPCFRLEDDLCVDGVAVDPDSDLTLLFVNNTIYGQFTDGGTTDFPAWTERGTELKVSLINGDYFMHGYVNVDFGGARGWENQFKSSVEVGGSGCWFTFGRAHWWMNSTPVLIPPAGREPYLPGFHKVHILYNFEPSRRLRFYQFDPLHHDVSIFSVH